MNNEAWIETISGKRIDLAHPNPKDIILEDVVAGLSKTARFNGQTKGFLSVAQHLVNTQRFLEEEGETLLVQFAGLTHDLSEGLIHDLSKPLKSLLPAYVQMEKKITDVIVKGLKLDRVLCLTKEQWKTVKRADRIMLLTERRDFKAKLNWKFYRTEGLRNNLRPWSRRLRSMPWWRAEQLYLDTYRDLMGRLK